QAEEGGVVAERSRMAGTELDGTLVLAVGSRPIPAQLPAEGEGAMGIRQPFVQLQRPRGGGGRFAHGLLLVHLPVVAKEAVGVGQLGRGRCGAGLGAETLT